MYSTSVEYSRVRWRDVLRASHFMAVDVNGIAASLKTFGAGMIGVWSDGRMMAVVAPYSDGGWAVWRCGANQEWGPMFGLPTRVGDSGYDCVRFAIATCVQH